MEFRTKSHGVGLKSHGLVWNLTGWFEISRVGLKSHRLVWNLTGFIWNLTGFFWNLAGFVWNLTGFVWNLMGFFWITWGHLKYHRFLYLIKKIGNCRGASSLQQPSINLVVKSPLGLERPSSIWISISIVALSLAYFCWNLPLLSPNTTHGDRGSRPKGKFDIQIEQGPSTLKAALILTVYKSENYYCGI